MDNTVSCINFKANIKTLTKVNNVKAFEQVMKDFEKSTKKYHFDTLYITKCPSGSFSWHIVDSRYSSLNDEQEIFTNSIDKHINEIGIKKFTQKLVNAFKAFILEKETRAKFLELNAELNKARSLVQTFTNIANACVENGNEIFAKRFFVIANRNEAKAERVAYELKTQQQLFDKEIDKLSEEFNEIRQIEL